MLIAITREVSASLAQCQLTHLPRTPIDVGRAHAQHAAYEATLQSLGAQILRAAPAPDLPDAVFVEDTAVVVDEGAIITLPGADARRAEVEAVAAVLRNYRTLHFISGDGRLDGGDVLRLGRKFFVGRTARTNAAGIDQLRQFVGAWGYQVQAIDVTGCLHLKSAVTQVGQNLLLVNPAWLPADSFAGMERIEVDPHEPYAANGLLVEGRVIYPEHFPRTRERLEKRGLRVLPVPCDELAKAEGAVTCCSLLIST